MWEYWGSSRAWSMERREHAKIQLWPGRNRKIHSSQKIPAPNRAQALLTAAQPQARSQIQDFLLSGTNLAEILKNSCFLSKHFPKFLHAQQPNPLLPGDWTPGLKFSPYRDVGICVEHRSGFGTNLSGGSINNWGGRSEGHFGDANIFWIIPNGCRSLKS